MVCMWFVCGNFDVFPNHVDHASLHGDSHLHKEHISIPNQALIPMNTDMSLLMVTQPE